MRNLAERRTAERGTNPFRPDTTGGRQNPAAALLADRLGADHPDLCLVLVELNHLCRYGVTITPEMVEQAIATIEKRRTPPPPPRPSRTIGIRDGRITELPEPVVYYMRIGNRVKIGFTTNLPLRLKAITPEELMATELSTRPSLEAERHREFAEYRTHGEWFRLEGRLAEHIGRLRKAR